MYGRRLSVVFFFGGGARRIRALKAIRSSALCQVQLQELLESGGKRANPKALEKARKKIGEKLDWVVKTYHYSGFHSFHTSTTSCGASCVATAGQPYGRMPLRTQAPRIQVKVRRNADRVR